MKIFVLNSSGNVGKSLISRELFYPRLDNPLIVEVETVNKGSKEIAHLNVEQFKSGDDFTNLYMQLMEVENVIVDVGASNLGNFWEQMSEFAGVETMFDYFIIPSVSGDKEMTDTYKTIQFLRVQGIEESKIRVIFNRVSNSVEIDFAVLLSADFPFDKDLSIKDSNLFKELGLMRQTIADIYNPNLDFYKSQILAAKEPKEKFILVKKDLSNRMAVNVKENLDFLFTRITGLDVAELEPTSVEMLVDEPKVTKPKKETKKAVKETVTAEEDLSVNPDDEEDL
jgi:hypothetical protein